MVGTGDKLGDQLRLIHGRVVCHLDHSGGRPPDVGKAPKWVLSYLGRSLGWGCEE
jgi:hypothetical protein